MPSIYRAVRSVYHTVLPESVKDWLRDRSNPLNGPFRRIKLTLEKGAEHDEVYDATYYEGVDEVTRRVAGPIATSVMEKFSPKTVVDVGCGSGAVLLAFKEHGVSGIGLEYSEAALDFCRKRSLQVRKFDLEGQIPTDVRADVAISTEVAEHLPEAVADRYVDLLCSIADRVVLTAATPGQGGTDHVNEQPNEYWIDKFARRRFSHLEEVTRTWRRAWREQAMSSCYSDNVMVFERAPSGASPA